MSSPCVVRWQSQASNILVLPSDPPQAKFRVKVPVRAQDQIGQDHLPSGISPCSRPTSTPFQAQLGGDSAPTGNAHTRSSCQGRCQPTLRVLFPPVGLQGRPCTHTTPTPPPRPTPHGDSPEGLGWLVQLLKIVPARSQNQCHHPFHTRYQHRGQWNHSLT